MFNLFGAPKSKCPYCNFVFSVSPKRSSKCSSCGKKFYVYQGKPITEIEKLKLDLWRSVEWTGLVTSDIDSAVEKGGMQRSERDYIHGLFNLAILREKSNMNRPEKLASFYSMMVYRAKSNNESYQHLLHLYENEQLRYYTAMTGARWTKQEIDKMVKGDVDSLDNSQ